MTIRHLTWVATVAGLAGTADAQFINRAVWLGDEREGLRRDYRQDEEYFVDRAGVVERAPWAPRGVFGDRIEIAAGSVNSSELTVEAAAAVGVELGRGAEGRIDYLQSEHQSARFERFAFGMDVDVADALALFAQVEGTSDKSRADLSLGVDFASGASARHRIGLTLVDVADSKSQEFAYERQPLGLGLAGCLGAPDGHGLTYELGLQLPFEQRDLDTGELFAMRRAIGRIEGRARLGERDTLSLGVEGELTAKSLEDSATPETGDVALARLRGEWWRRGGSGREYALGLSYLGLDEEYDVPGNPASAGTTQREEWMLTARARLPLGGAWSVEPYAIGGRVELETTGSQMALDGESFQGFQGRCGAPLRFDFSDAAWLRIDLSMQLDKLAFGGAALQLAASF